VFIWFFIPRKEKIDREGLRVGRSEERKKYCEEMKVMLEGKHDHGKHVTNMISHLLDSLTDPFILPFIAQVMPISLAITGPTFGQTLQKR